MEKFLNIIAWAISIVFHPLGMTVVGCAIYIYCYLTPFFPIQNDYFKIILDYCLPVFALYYLLPIILCSVYALFFRKNFDLNSKRHRLVMLCIVILSYSTNLLFNGLNTYILNEYLVCCNCLLVIALVISYSWRISLHTIGIGGVIGLLCYLQICQPFASAVALSLLPPILVVAGLIGSARLQLNAHTPLQVYVGYLVGIVGVCAGMAVTSAL